MMWRDLSKHLFLRNKDGIQAIYANGFFRAIALGVFGIFIPIYVFLIFGGGSNWIIGLRWVATLVIVERLIIALLSIEVGKIIEKIGFRKSVLVATILQIIVLVLLMKLESQKELIFLISFVSAFVTMFYWIARQGLFANDGKNEEFGREISNLSVMERGAAILGPFSGGVIVTLWGFEVLFILGIIILILSAMPLFFMMHHVHQNGIGYAAFKNFITDKNKSNYILGFVGTAMDDVITSWVWPVFMFVIIGNYEQLGALVSGVTIVSVVTIFIVGRVFDTQRQKGGMQDEMIFWIAAVLTSSIRMVTGLVRTIWGVLGIDLLSVIVRPFYWLPFGSYQYLAAKQESPVAFFVFREVIYSVGVMGTMILVYIFASMEYGWSLIFGMGGVGVLISMVIAKK